MSRQERLNKLFLQSLSTILSQSLPLKDSLVTIKKVSLSPNLSLGDVWVSILPINFAGSTLKLLRKNSKQLSFQASSKIKLRQVPKLLWKVDESEKEVSELEEIFNKIRQEKD